MTGAAGLGPWPGTEALEAQLAVLDLPADAPVGAEGLPHLVQLPARGPVAGSVGRTLALLEAMPAGLEPHGWRLRSTPDAELRRARAALQADVEALALAAHAYAGQLVLPVLGPWSLASRVWLPRGERALTDPSAMRDLADSLAVGVLEHVAEVRRRVPGASPVVLLHEPALLDVLAGAVPTFSGRGRLAAVPAAEVRASLRRVVAGIEAGGPVVLHVPADPVAARLGAGCGTGELGLDVTRASPGVWEEIAAAVEGGLRPWLGAVPAEPVAGGGSATAAPLARAWRAVGLERSRLGDVVVTPTTGLAGLTVTSARAVLRATVDTARALAEDAEA